MIWLHLSISEIKCWLQCPEQHYHKYVLRTPKPKKAAITKGIVYDRATQYLYEAHRLGEETEPDSLAEFIRTEIAVLSPETEWDEETPEAAISEIITAAELYRESILPKINLVSYQQRFEVTFENRNWTFLGFIDLIDGNCVVDNKFLSRTPNQADVDQDLQLTAYALGYKWLYGELPRELRLDCVILKKKPEIVTIPTRRTERDVERFLRMLGAVGDAITSGIVFPNPTGWWCSEKSCQYWSECKERW